MADGVTVRLHPLAESLPDDRLRQLQALRAFWAGCGETVVVAYSGGVDSTLVLAVAVEQLGPGAVAVTGVSPALAPELLEEARHQARWLGASHRELPTAELDDPAYSSNPVTRCHACKQELHGRVRRLVGPGPTVVDGVNVDDLGDHRPGIIAAREHGVLSPLVACGIDKAGVRQLSRALGFPWWDKPAQPCLASRFPYGETITADRLQRVGRLEAWLRSLGCREVRVRSQGETARIEIPADQIPDFLARHDRNQLLSRFRREGFEAVSLDLEGLVSGKLNRGLSRPAHAPVQAGTG